MNQPPRITVALAAIDDYATVEEVHRCLEAQSIREQLEIQFICRSREKLALPAEFEQRHTDIVIIEGGEGLLLNEARELGVLAARAPFVLILEDHCLPFADCLERMLKKLEEGWSAVGPGFVSGNTASHTGIAANLLTYGEWMG
ncbi:MAG: glycosyltransferase, partial [Pirellulaceae bacterium]